MRTAGMVAVVCLVVVLSSSTFANADGGVGMRFVQPMGGDPEHAQRAGWQELRPTVGDPEFPRVALTGRTGEGDPEHPDRQWLQLIAMDAEFPAAARLVRHLVELFAATPLKP